ncbi:helix-turn-helix domain-containing protein [Streptomyces sp. DH12]|uniref:helix-turn-helix domain-containing protein n=1 Tax=Streptomyces sp. DH12 TaxID=2857010 RepID=UPI001E52B32E|nr:helix-turn-helix domain-containing protein [Streptomyces sp. DH12]
MSKTVRLREHRYDIIDAYKQGATLSDLARRHSATTTDIRTLLLSNSVPLRTERMPGPEVVEALVAAYASGGTVNQLARDYQLGTTTVRRVLVENGVKVRNQGLTQQQRAEVRRLYAQGESAAAIARVFGVARMTVQKAVEEHGGTMRSHAEARAVRRGEVPVLSDEELVQRYQAGDSMVRLAEEFHVGTSTLRRRLRALGVPSRRRGGA